MWEGLDNYAQDKPFSNISQKYSLGLVWRGNSGHCKQPEKVLLHSVPTSASRTWLCSYSYCPLSEEEEALTPFLHSVTPHDCPAVERLKKGSLNFSVCIEGLVFAVQSDCYDVGLPTHRLYVTCGQPVLMKYSLHMLLSFSIFMHSNVFSLNCF